MAIELVSALNKSNQIAAKPLEQNGFSQVLAQKKQPPVKNVTSQVVNVQKSPEQSVRVIVQKMSQKHERVTKLIKSSLNKTDNSPADLLKMQYKTGVFFLREQMFAKSAELSATTFKNFSQMQV